MKVVLTAFQGKLMSQPIEWPEGQADRIRLPMDIDVLKMSAQNFKGPEMAKSPVICEFVRTGRVYAEKDFEGHEYILVDINK